MFVGENGVEVEWKSDMYAIDSGVGFRFSRFLCNGIDWLHTSPHCGVCVSLNKSHFARKVPSILFISSPPRWCIAFIRSVGIIFPAPSTPKNNEHISPRDYARARAHQMIMGGGLFVPDTNCRCSKITSNCLVNKEIIGSGAMKRRYCTRTQSN